MSVLSSTRKHGGISKSFNWMVIVFEVVKRIIDGIEKIVKIVERGSSSEYVLNIVLFIVKM